MDDEKGDSTVLGSGKTVRPGLQFQVQKLISYQSMGARGLVFPPLGDVQ